MRAAPALALLFASCVRLPSVTLPPPPPFDVNGDRKSVV